MKAASSLKLSVALACVATESVTHQHLKAISTLPPSLLVKSVRESVKKAKMAAVNQNGWPHEENGPWLQQSFEELSEAIVVLNLIVLFKTTAWRG